MTDLRKPPKKPICREADDSGPCRYAGSCSASRQLIQGGWKKTAGLWVQTKADELRGLMCWAFTMIAAKPSKRGAVGVSETSSSDDTSLAGTDSPPDSERAA